MSILATIKRKLDFISKLNDLFNRKEKFQFLGVITMALIMALFQVLGIASILPFVNLVMNENIVYENEWLNYFYELLGFTSPNSFIFFVGFVVLGFLVVGNLISAFATWLKLSFVWRKNHRFSTTLLKKYLSLPYVYFLSQNTADLGKNILFEVQQLTGSFLLPLLKIITGSMVALAIFAMLLFVNPLMTLIVAVVLTFLYLLIYLKFSQKLKIKGKERIEENKQRFKSAGEALGGIKDIRVLGREGYFLQKFSKHSKKFSVLQAWYQVIGQVPRYIMEIVAFGGVIGLILFLVSSEHFGREIIPLVGFFAFAGYRLMPALQQIFDSFTAFRFNKAVLDKIHKDMTEGGIKEKDVSFTRELPKPILFKESIKLENISFSYPGTNEAVLRDINLETKRNTSIAIVGPTGSGKTTLVDILLGLLVPSKGTMKVDNVEIKEENVKNWQANIGYVPQQIYLSDDTITRNIAFGLPDDKIDMEQIRCVARMANIDQFIENELPKGYETIIGERGIRLSGGERQRVGVARALYHNPEVLVFDEATSSLDNVTERAVLKATESVSKLKTMIIIAHRLTTVKNCDIIYLVDKGRIVAQDAYDDLIKKNAQFRAMAREVK